MLGNFLRRSADLKQRQIRNKTLELMVMSQAEAKEGARNVCFLWHPLEAAMSVCYAGLFFFVKIFFIILE